MTGEQLTVAIFCWGSAVVIGLDALKSDGWRRIALWSLTAIFVVVGITIKPLWDRFPDVSSWLAELVGSPLAWFGLALVAYMGIRGPFPQRQQSPTPERTEPDQQLPPLRILQQPETDTKLRLTDGERARLSAVLLAVDDYLKGPLAAFLQPLRELRNYQTLLQTLGAGEFHRMVEAPRPTMRQFIDAYAEFAKPHLVETTIVDIDLMAIKLKSLPLWEALREVSDVSQALAPDSIQPSPLKPVMRAFNSVLDELDDQVNLIQRQVDENRQKLARGELG